MQFSIGNEYALHCLLHMVGLPKGKLVGIKELAEYQNITETYLSKIFAKLKKADIVKSVPGVKGGYMLAREPDDISFWDVVDAVEGYKEFFICAEIRQREKFLDPKNLPDSYCKTPCLIHQVMDESQKQMKKYLEGKTLGWLYRSVTEKCGDMGVPTFAQWVTGEVEKS